MWVPQGYQDEDEEKIEGKKMEDNIIQKKYLHLESFLTL